jgi:Putative peptidoglycan binding domain
MPLTSPRFRQEADFNAVAAGRKALRRGARGRNVHLIQMALLDLGSRMPISTGSNDFSPDGIYGVETERVVKEFQRSVPGLNADGVVG